jgi:RND family efflux transporter MFP subunit
VKKHLFLLLIPALFILQCGGGDDSSQRPDFSRFAGFSANRTTSVETITVSQSTIADQVRSYGTVKAQDLVTVVPQVSNRLTNIYVDLGDEVRAGQLMAKIYDKTFRDQLNQAKAQVEQSKIALQRDSTQYNRQLQLLEKELISDSEYEIALATYRNAIAQLESAKASLTQAQENFNFTEVRAPVSGVVVSRALEVGDLAPSGQTLFELASNSGYESRIFLPIQDWRAVLIGQTVQLRVSNESAVSARGVISRKSPQLDPTTGLGEVVITLTEVGNAIYPGVLVENLINIQTKENAIVIPRSALVEVVETVVNPESNTIELERSYSVFVSNGDSVAERRTLELGIEQGDKIEVLSGLSSGDNIIITGQQGLEDGGRISVASGALFQTAEENTIESGNTNNEGGSAVSRTNNRSAASGNGNPFANLTDEQREKLRNMSPEERRAYFQQLRQAGSDSSASANNSSNR